MKDEDLVMIDDIECIKEQSIEEAATKYAENCDDGYEAEEAFIAGAKSNEAKEYWQQNMSSYDDISHAIGYTYSQCKQDLSHDQILREYNKVHRKPYNSDITKELHTKDMYSEDEVKKSSRKI